MATPNLSGVSTPESWALSIERDKAGNAVFQPFRRPGEEKNDLLATDALRIGELKTTYISATGRDSLSPNKPSSERLIITTANAHYLPEVNLGEQRITFCEDGRWGAEDWAQWPQWYFDGQEYFSYVLRKPCDSELDQHPLKALWFQMKDIHFLPRTQTSGILIPAIAQQIYDVRLKLMEEVNSCQTFNPNDWRLLHESARRMRSFTSSLLFTPQDYCSVMLTVAAAQRACLSTRAILDKIKKWDSMSLTSSSRVDNRIMGCVTDRVSIVHEMFEKGVPVWYVRPISYLPKDMNIVSAELVVHPKAAGIITTPWKDAPIFYHGVLSPRIHDAISQWKPGTLDIRFLPGLSGDNSTNNLNNVSHPELNNRYNPYSTSKALEQVDKRKNKRGSAINKALFADLPSPIATKTPAVWKRALAAVVVDVERTIDHPNQKLFHGYAFPPPHIFCSAAGQNPLELMLSWIVIRPSWMEKFSSEAASALPNPQQWRNYLRDIALNLELLRKDMRKKNFVAASRSSSTSNSSDAPSSKSRNAKLKEAARGIFTIEVPSLDTVTSLTWCKRVVWERSHEVEFPLLYQRLLVWDVQEHNFRLELMTLDRTLLPDIWNSPGSKAIRIEKLTALWCNDFILMRDLPSKPLGLATKDLSLRRFFLRALQDLLAEWPGETPKKLSTFVLRQFVDDRMQWNEKALQEFEVLASQFYCQVFFDYFGRAPCVPPEYPDS